jgi:hypothetical protein
VVKKPRIDNELQIENKIEDVTPPIQNEVVAPIISKEDKLASAKERYLARKAKQ